MNTPEEINKTEYLKTESGLSIETKKKSRMEHWPSGQKGQ